MKRITAILLTLMIIICLTVTANAATEGSLTLTTTVGDNPPTWNLSIPADMDIPFGNESTVIGEVTLSDMKNPDNHTGNVDVIINYGNLKSGSNEIPLKINGRFLNTNYNETYTYEWNSGGRFSYRYYRNSIYNTFVNYMGSFGKTSNKAYPVTILAAVNYSDWDKAAPGVYTSTLTFTSSYVTG